MGGIADTLLPDRFGHCPLPHRGSRKNPGEPEQVLCSLADYVTLLADNNPNRLDAAAARVSAESVAVIPRCAECDARWLPAEEER
jgi:hypothetical protein